MWCQSCWMLEVQHGCLELRTVGSQNYLLIISPVDLTRKKSHFCLQRVYGLVLYVFFCIFCRSENLLYLLQLFHIQFFFSKFSSGPSTFFHLQTLECSETTGGLYNTFHNATRNLQPRSHSIPPDIIHSLLCPASGNAVCSPRSSQPKGCICQGKWPTKSGSKRTCCRSSICSSKVFQFKPKIKTVGEKRRT